MATLHYIKDIPLLYLFDWSIFKKSQFKLSIYSSSILLKLQNYKIVKDAIAALTLKGIIYIANL